jgi:hypothetical protein
MPLLSTRRVPYLGLSAIRTSGIDGVEVPDVGWLPGAGGVGVVVPAGVELVVLSPSSGLHPIAQLTGWVVIA